MSFKRENGSGLRTKLPCMLWAYLHFIILVVHVIFCSLCTVYKPMITIMYSRAVNERSMNRGSVL
jgi:hypothetical protein